MTFWKNVLCPKKEGLSIAETASMASTAGLPMFMHGGKLFNVGTDPDKPAFTDSGMVPEQFEQPDIYCVMDAKRERIAMSRDGTGPLLFCNPVIALLVAEKYDGEAELFFAALWKQKQILKDGPRLIVPSGDTVFVPE